MPIDLNSSLKGASQWAFGSKLLNNMVGSSIFVALAISLLMVLLIMFMYPAKSGTPFSVLAKLFVYMVFGTVLILFLHDSVLTHLVEERINEKDDEYFMQNTTMQGREADPAYAGMYKRVSPQPMIPSATQPIVPAIAPPVITPPVQPIATDTITGGFTGGGPMPIKPNRSMNRNPYE
jgi:hypothetical protein